jgi:hypothetical protein
MNMVLPEKPEDAAMREAYFMRTPGEPPAQLWESRLGEVSLNAARGSRIKIQ